MSALITPAETTIGASLVALVSVVVALRVATGTRRQAREDRLWNARSAAYVDLLHWCIRQRELSKITPDQHALVATINMPSTEDQIALEARVSAFASRSVDRKVDEILPFWNRLRVAWGELELLRDLRTEGEVLRTSFQHDVVPAKERWTSAAQEIERWSGELIELVKDEIQSLRAMRT